MAENHKTQPVPRVYPFNRETVRLIVGDPDATLSRTTLSICEICGPIPDSVSLAAENGAKRSAVPDSAGRLTDHAEIKGSLKLLKCPVCGCLYKLERKTEFLLGAGEKEWTLTRLQRGDAFELLLGQQAKAILKRDDKWVFEW
jgi:hypothetical protein